MNIYYSFIEKKILYEFNKRKLQLPIYNIIQNIYIRRDLFLEIIT